MILKTIANFSNIFSTTDEQRYRVHYTKSRSIFPTKLASRFIHPRFMMLERLMLFLSLCLFVPAELEQLRLNIKMLHFSYKRRNFGTSVEKVGRRNSKWITTAFFSSPYTSPALMKIHSHNRDNCIIHETTRRRTNERKRITINHFPDAPEYSPPLSRKYSDLIPETSPARLNNPPKTMQI